MRHLGLTRGPAFRLVQAGYWELFPTNGHMEAIRRGEALADRIAAKLVPHPARLLRRMLNERNAWEEKMGTGIRRVMSFW